MGAQDELSLPILAPERGSRQLPRRYIRMRMGSLQGSTSDRMLPTIASIRLTVAQHRRCLTYAASKYVLVARDDLCPRRSIFGEPFDIHVRYQAVPIITPLNPRTQSEDSLM